MAEHGFFYKDELKTCPYNDAHSILQSRMQTHLVKCRKGFPESEKKMCPFNSVHHVRIPEMIYHMSICPDRGVIDSFKYSVSGTSTAAEALPVDNRHIPTEENWDEDDNPSYDPNERLRDGRLLVQKKGATPSERSHFRVERREMYQTVTPNNTMCGNSELSEECGAEPFHPMPSTSTSQDYHQEYAFMGIE